MPRRRKTLSDFWLSSATAGVDTWITLAHRVPMLMTGAAPEAERRRMVAEKVEAGVASTFAAGRKAGDVLRRKPTLDPLVALGRAAEVAQAAARPFHTRVASNAGRLSRAKMPKRSG